MPEVLFGAKASDTTLGSTGPFPHELNLPLLPHHHVFDFGSSIYQRLFNV